MQHARFHKRNRVSANVNFIACFDGFDFKRSMQLRLNIFDSHVRGVNFFRLHGGYRLRQRTGVVHFRVIGNNNFNFLRVNNALYARHHLREKFFFNRVNQRRFFT